MTEQGAEMKPQGGVQHWEMLYDGKINHTRYPIFVNTFGAVSTRRALIEPLLTVPTAANLVRLSSPSIPVHVVDDPAVRWNKD
jgi:hypothetical protein